VPAERCNTPGQRFYHINGNDRSRRIAERKTNPANAPVVELFQFRIRDRRAQNGNTSCIRAKLGNCVDGDRIVYGIVALLNNNVARSADALLQ
jgi:hypothetical protein